MEDIKATLTAAMVCGVYRKDKFQFYLNGSMKYDAGCCNCLSDNEAGIEKLYLMMKHKK